MEANSKRMKNGGRVERASLEVIYGNAYKDNKGGFVMAPKGIFGVLKHLKLTRNEALVFVTIAGCQDVHKPSQLPFISKERLAFLLGMDTGSVGRAIRGLVKKDMLKPVRRRTAKGDECNHYDLAPGRAKLATVCLVPPPDEDEAASEGDDKGGVAVADDAIGSAPAVLLPFPARRESAHLDGEAGAGFSARVERGVAGAVRLNAPERREAALAALGGEAGQVALYEAFAGAYRRAVPGIYENIVEDAGARFSRAVTQADLGVAADSLASEAEPNCADEGKALALRVVRLFGGKFYREALARIEEIRPRNVVSRYLAMAAGDGELSPANGNDDG